MHRHVLRGVAVGIIGAVVGTLGFSAPASADPVDDLPIVLENLPDAADTLIAGLQGALDTALGTQSAVATSAAVGDALVASGTVLVQGTEQLAALSLGFTILNGTAQDLLGPVLTAVDDPSQAGDVVDPDDVTTLLENLEAGLDGLLHGFSDNGLTCTVADLLRGDVWDDFGHAVVNCTVVAPIAATQQLTQGTRYQQLPAPLLVVGFAVMSTGQEYFVQLEDALAPLFEALGPLTEPVAAAVEGI